MRGGWAQWFQDNHARLTQGLSLECKGAFADLVDYMGRRNTTVHSEIGGVGDPANLTRIAEIWGVSRWTARRIMKELVARRLVRERRVGNSRQYDISPSVAHRFPRRSG